MAVIGDEIKKSVAIQINARQKLHGAGVKEKRNDSQLKVLNSTNAWIKIASGISLTKEKAKELGLSSTYSGYNLPKNYVLYNGISNLSGTTLKNRRQFLDGMYEYSDFGLVPMPGTTKFSVKNLNRGSLKKATLNFTCHSKDQFTLIDVLYLRLGYTVLIEWGNNHYTRNGKDYKVTGNTVTEESFFKENMDYNKIGSLISAKRAKLNSNYDGLIGKISNFEWKYNEDGSYDITITVISIGDVIESLKSNLPVDNSMVKIQEFVDKKHPQNIEGREKSQIHSLLWTWKYANRNENYSGAKTAEKTWYDGGDWSCIILQVGSSDFDVYSYYYKWYYYGYHYDPNGIGKQGGYSEYTVSTYYDVTYSEDENKTSKPANFKSDRRWNALYQRGKSSGRDKHEDWSEWADDHWTDVKVSDAISPNPRKTKVGGPGVPNPAAGIRFGDGIKFANKDEECFHFWRFGSLLQYIQENVIPVYESEGEDVPVLTIDFDETSSQMFLLPNQLSLDTKKCFIFNQFKYPVDFTDKWGNKKTKGRYPFNCTKLKYTKSIRSLDATPPTGGKNKWAHVNKGLPMNIYLNFDFITEVLNNNIDKDNNISIYKFIVGICEGLNATLGGINNLEPVIDEETNILRIIDQTPIPGYVKDNPKTDYQILLYGYNKYQNRGTFARKVDIKTAITPEFATMVTVGSTASGYVKGVEATAFTKWNAGIKDRFKQKLKSPVQSVQENNKNGYPDPVANYFEKYLMHGMSSFYCHKDNIFWNNSFPVPDYDSSTADVNKNVVNEFYKYVISTWSELKGAGNTSSTIGFIPFKMSLTLDGISGIKIYNVIRVDSSFLPESYGNNLNFIVTGISHNITNNDWETELQLTVMPKSTVKSGTIENLEWVFDEKIMAGIEKAKKRMKQSPPKNINKNNDPPIPIPEGTGGNGKRTLGTASEDFAKYSYVTEDAIAAAIKVGTDIIDNL